MKLEVKVLLKEPKKNFESASEKPPESTKCTPVFNFKVDPNDIEKTINEAIHEMNKRGITGKDTTPFLLARIAEQTKGESLDTNIKLVLNNAKLAAEIAAELCKL